MEGLVRLGFAIRRAVSRLTDSPAGTDVPSHMPG